MIQGVLLVIGVGRREAMSCEVTHSVMLQLSLIAYALASLPPFVLFLLGVEMPGHALATFSFK